MKVAIIAVAVILLLLILWYIVTYNGFVKLRNFVQESWRQIDVELKRRRDLIPNLVETVRGYMAHEQMTLQAVVEARRLAEAPAASADFPPPQAVTMPSAQITLAAAANILVLLFLIEALLNVPFPVLPGPGTISAEPALREPLEKSLCGF